MTHFEEIKQMFNESGLFYIIATGMDGNYSYVNGNYARQFSHINPNFVGQPYHITMHADDRNTCSEVAAKCFAKPGSLFPATIRKHDGKGGYVYTQWEYRAMFDADGSPAGVFCMGYNITKYVAEGMQLREAREEIAKNSEVLEKIVFQQSHLIRAPLSNIMGLTDVLDKSTLDENASNICDMISESARQLDGVIRQIVGMAHE